MEKVTRATTSTDNALISGDLIAKARQYARQSKSPATLKVYSTVWRIFTQWCETRDLGSLPASPEVVVAYIADQADRLRPITIKKHLAAISQVHKLRGFDSPVQTEPVRLTLQGLRRVKGVASVPKKALRVEHVKAMVERMPDSLVGGRDAAVVLLGFVTGMRRSEIVALDVADIEWEPEGVVVTIRKSKGDQEGKGRRVAVLRGRHEATCPVRALRHWLEVSGITEGHLFIRLDPAGSRQRLSDKAVARIVQGAASRAGLDPRMFAGHSLRRGFCTETARAGAAESEIARSTGHASMKVLRSYIDEGHLFERCAGRHLDL